MNEKEIIKQIIFQRRSIRKYTYKPIPEDIITFLLQAAMAAPTANNYQPWSFIVVNERKILFEIADAHPYGKMLKDASIAIVVLGDPSVSPRYWPLDCSAATENILLAAAGIGLGGVWLAVYPRKEREMPIKNLLEIPDPLRILSAISIGYPNEYKKSRTQYKPEKVMINKWNKD